MAWAAVGRLPANWNPEPAGRVVTADVPLQGMPGWLGVDRALAGWLAWLQRGEAVLVADAGTVLSLTRVDRDGRFAGGRLMAGLGLQWRAMAEGTAALPGAPPPGELSDLLAQGGWPDATGAAMAVGLAHGLAAALAMAWRQARPELPGCRLVLTGGDAPHLLPLVRALLVGETDAAELEPDLALRGLVALRPAPLPWNQASPRSAST
jgi:type III pantothenate kinase